MLYLSYKPFLHLKIYIFMPSLKCGSDQHLYVCKQVQEKHKTDLKHKSKMVAILNEYSELI